MAADGQEVPKWRRCELKWMSHLASLGQAVTRLADADHNAIGAAAPLIHVGGRRLRAPDIEATNAGRSTYWEVKYRSRADVNPDTGRSEFWMDFAAFKDYRDVQAATQKLVRVILFNGSAVKGEHWLTATIADLESDGRREEKVLADGAIVEAWVWPADRMELIDGPHVDFDAGPDDPVFPVEADEVPIPVERLLAFERELRGNSNTSTARAGSDVQPLPAGVMDVLRGDARTSLDVLRRSLGIPKLPRYSVLRIGLADLDVNEVLALLRYGIRVFIVATERPDVAVDAEQLEAFEQSRLLEWAVVPTINGGEGWYVDGGGLDDPQSPARITLEAADRPAGINVRQFLIVHADAERDVLVTAGAGTGKTETMSERIVYLLATGMTRADPTELRQVSDLRLDDIALMTFTRESAAEMRRRIARTLMLRQRLCDRCVLPAVAWLTQLSATDVDTIHTFAKKVLQRDGAVIGLIPGFSVSQQTMEFRRHVDRALSPHLERLLDSQHAGSVPPIHEFEKFVRELWEKLAENGLSPMSLTDGPPVRRATWGTPPLGVEQEIAEAFEAVIGDVARAFAESCKEHQAVPVSELVPGAIAVLGAAGDRIRRKPRYLFVDEFQDTDAEQMDLVLELRRSSGTRLFVVGDEKQGIYRFRGAQGNAFTELRSRMSAAGLSDILTFGLTRNFRSGRQLLDSLHSWFTPWGGSGFLTYDVNARLVDSGAHPDQSQEAEPIRVGRGHEKSALIAIVNEWLTGSPNESIALLCRQNRDAHDFRDALRASGIPCELRVGGEFFRTPVVREARVLFEAVLDPDDDAAILELCETRWFGGLSEQDVPPGAPSTIADAWGTGGLEVIGWGERIASLAPSGRFDRRDLENVRARVRGLASQLQRQPTLAWLVECKQRLDPGACRLVGEPDDVELHRYARCFDHLVSLLDAAFADSAISPHRVLEWLRLQIATNHAEDEPAPPLDGSGARVIALTVHKAKGLEYDRVIIPRTGTRFGPPRNRSDVAVVGTDAGARLIYRWKPKTSVSGFKDGFTNVSRDDSSLWDEELDELVREEARLLYVAMTRPRKELKVLLSSAGRTDGRPTCWADLIARRQNNAG